MNEQAENAEASVKADSKTGVERKAYKLKRAHRHLGKLRAEGESINLTTRQAERLRKGKQPKI